MAQAQRQHIWNLPQPEASGPAHCDSVAACICKPTAVYTGKSIQCEGVCVLIYIQRSVACASILPLPPPAPYPQFAAVTDCLGFSLSV